MRKTFPIFFAMLVVLIFMTACSHEKFDRIEISKDKKLTIAITGERSTFLDPFLVSINTRGYGFDETITTEIHSGSIDSSNLKFDWRSNNECYISFVQQDNTIRKIHVQSSAESILLNEDQSDSD